MKRILLSFIIACVACVMNAAIGSGSINQMNFPAGEAVTFTVTFSSDRNVSLNSSQITLDGNGIDKSSVVLGGSTSNNKSDRTLTFTFPSLASGVHHLKIDEGALSYSYIGRSYKSPVFEADITVGIYFLRAKNDQNFYLGRGNRYGFRAVLDEWGLPVQITTDNQGVTLIKFIDEARRVLEDGGNGLVREYLYATDDNAVYTDTGDDDENNWEKRKWTLVKNGDWYYLKHDDLYTCATEGITSCDDISLTANQAQAIQWELVTPADHKAAMNVLREQVASVQIPTDKNVKTRQYIKSGSVSVKERYQGVAGIQMEDYTELLQPGTYEFTMKAFFRLKGASTTYSLGDDVDCPAAYIFIGDTKVKVYSVFDRDFGMDSDPGNTVYYGGKYYPDGVASAGSAFSNGQYIHRITFTLEEPKRLRYGICQIGNMGNNGHWLCWDENSISLTCYTVNSAANYVGRPYLNNEYVQPGDVEVVCLEAYAANSKNLQLVLDTELLQRELGDKASAFRQDPESGVIYYTVPEDGEPVTLPAGAIYFMVNRTKISSVEKELSYKSPLLTDGSYLLKNRATGQYLSRGGNFGTQAIFDNIGVPIAVATDGNNNTTFSFEDKDKYLFMTDDYAVFTDYDPGIHVVTQKEWHLKDEGGYYRFHNVELKHSAFVHSSGNAVIQLLEGDVVDWEFIRIEEAEADDLINIKSEGTLPESVLKNLDKINCLDLRNANLTETDKAAIRVADHPNLVIFTQESFREANDVVGGVCDSLVVTDGYKFSVSEGFSATKASYSRKVSTRWASMVLPFDVPVDPEQQAFELYQISQVKDDAIALDLIADDVLRAGTPVLARVEVGAEALPVEVEGVEVIPGEYFEKETIDGLTPKGTFVTMKIHSGLYVSKDKFYSVANRSDKTVTLNPFRGYYDCSDAAAATYRVVINENSGNETAIANLLQILNEGEYFDLNGRRIEQLQPGTNLVKSTNGKVSKVLIK